MIKSDFLFWGTKERKPNEEWLQQQEQVLMGYYILELPHN